MNRGKDDEKVMGPMFPRLHVNDTEKGGPRAPPRNKMALYEQLSIPSQRHNHGVLPVNPNTKSDLVPVASSSQGSGLERNMHFPLQLPPTLPHMDEKYHSHPSDGVNLGTQLAQLDQKNKVSDEEDFAVPVFVESGNGQDQSKTHKVTDGEKTAPSTPSYSRFSTKLQNTSEKGPKLISSQRLNLRQEVGFQSQEKPKDCVLDTEHRDHPVANVSRLHTDICLQHESRTGSLPKTRPGCIEECIRNIEMESTQRPSSESCTGSFRSSPDEPNNERDYLEDKRFGSLRGDVSEISMVDSISGLDISPDDIVGLIGQKHFWKARRAIVNQQRVFAVQVFELHRLIKVQRIIAGSPHLLLEDSAYVGQPSLKDSPIKKLPAEYVVTPPHNLKRNSDSEKSNHKMECSAENAVGKTSLSLIKNVSHPLNERVYLGNSPQSPVTTDAKNGPWSFPQPTGQQWLIPVVTPSEGLVYKPYPGPGFTGTAYGGYGPLGQTPFAGNFMTPNYGVPASHYNHHRGIGYLPGAPPAGHCYFPPYGMPVIHPAMSGSAVEQINRFAGPGLHGQVSNGEANYNNQKHSSCDVPTQKSKATSQAMKFQMSKGSEVQGSTGSSPAARMQGDCMDHTTNGKDSLPLFPMAPVDQEGVPQPCNSGQTTRAIKVVPHNRRSATESVARIFQSIQEERNQYD